MVPERPTRPAAARAQYLLRCAAGGLGAALALAGPAAAQAPRFTLDTVQVQVGSRASAALPFLTRSVVVISAEDIRLSPARTVADVLSNLVGFDVLSRSPAQTDVSIRGGTFEQILVLVDGVRMSDPQTGHFDLDVAVPLNEIERIEVLRGGASALYGSDAMTGVINIVTRRAGSGWEASLERGSFTTWGGVASAGGTVRGLYLRGGADLQQSDGHRSGTDYQNLQTRLAAERALAGGALRAELAHAIRDFGAANFYGAYPSYEETRTSTASLSWVAAGADGRAPRATTVEPRLSWRSHHDDFVLFRGEPARYQNVHDSRQLGAEVIARHTRSERFRVAGGAEAFAENLESTNLGDHTESRQALFAEIGAGTLGRAALTAGVRYDHHSAFGSFFAPSAAAAFWPHSDVRLRLSATRGFRAPSANELYYQDPANIGSVDLQPERSYEIEGGVEVALGSAAHVSLGAFRRSADDLIDWAKPAGSLPTVPWRTMNIEHAVFRGIEAEADLLDERGGRWSAGVALLSFESSDEQGFVSKYALRPLGETLTVTAEQPLLWGLRVLARGTRARRRGEDPYFLLDGRLSLRQGTAELFVDARNLTDARYRDVSVVPGAAPQPAPAGTLEFIAAPGRALYAGVSLRMR